MISIYIDVETTGLIPNKNYVTQIGMILTVDDAPTREYMSYLKPLKGGEVHPAALQKTGISIEELEEKGKDREQVFMEIEAILDEYIDRYNKSDKAFFYAYNSPFDNQFMRAFWSENNNNYFGSYFWTPDICVMRLAMEYLQGVRHKLEDFRQETVAKYLGVDLENGVYHDALFDVRTTIEIHKILQLKQKEEK